MPVPLKRLKSLWHRFNGAYFGGELTEPKITADATGGFNAIFVVDLKKNKPQIILDRGIFDRRLDDFQWESIEYLILHEMIHQYLWQRGYEDFTVEGVKEDKHSKEFSRMLKQIRKQREREYLSSR